MMKKETFSATDEVAAKLQLERWKKAHPGVTIKKETIDKNLNTPIGRYSAPAKPTVTIKIEYE
jgi:hypothetical protein